MSNSKFRRHVVSRGAQCPEDDMERNVGESKLFKGVQVICSITALNTKSITIRGPCFIIYKAGRQHHVQVDLTNYSLQ